MSLQSLTSEKLRNKALLYMFYIVKIESCLSSSDRTRLEKPETLFPLIQKMSPHGRKFSTAQFLEIFKK